MHFCLIRKCYPRKKSFWGHRTKSVQFNFLFLTRSGKIIPEDIDLRFYAISSFLGQSPTKFNSNQLNSANPNLGFLTVLYLREIIFYTTPKRTNLTARSSFRGGQKHRGTAPQISCLLLVAMTVPAAKQTFDACVIGTVGSCPSVFLSTAR